CGSIYCGGGLGRCHQTPWRCLISSANFARGEFTAGAGRKERVELNCANCTAVQRKDRVLKASEHALNLMITSLLQKHLGSVLIDNLEFGRARSNPFVGKMHSFCKRCYIILVDGMGEGDVATLYNARRRQPKMPRPAAIVG